MADDTTDPSATDGTTDPEDHDDDTGQADELPEGARKALHAARREARDAEKARRALEAELQQYRDRDKTETEKLAEKASAAEKRAAEAEARALRLEVAHAKGLTAAQAKRLMGSTREELEADADELLAAWKPNGKRTDFEPGPKGGAPPPSGGMNQLLADAIRNRR